MEVLMLVGDFNARIPSQVKIGRVQVLSPTPGPDIVETWSETLTYLFIHIRQHHHDQENLNILALFYQVTIDE